MIKSVKVINYLGQTLTMELRNPELSGFLITDITGLGPVKATINQTEILSSNGAVFNSSRLTSRNIVLYLQFMWKDTIEDVRLASYSWFGIGRQLMLIIETDKRVCYTTGWVESNEPTVFSQDEGTQISIVCPDSYFYEYNDGRTNKVSFDSVTKNFTFPFMNNSLTDKLLIFGNMQNGTRRTVSYAGDAEVGMIIHIHARGSASGLVGVYNTSFGDSIKIDTDVLNATTGNRVIAGDDILIDTRKGHKAAVLERDGVTINILHCLTQDSEWLTLRPGRNDLLFAATGVTNLSLEIEHYVAYEGV